MPEQHRTEIHRTALTGACSLAAAATFVFGFALYATALTDYTADDLDADEAVAFLVEHQGQLFAWNLGALIVFGLVLVPLVLGLRNRSRAASPLLADVTAAFGLIWSALVLAAGMIGNLSLGVVADLHPSDPALASPVWVSLSTVQDAVGGGNELIGGLWVVLASVALHRAGRMSIGLAVTGILAGSAGIATVLPALGELGAVFGLGSIVWFVWLGASLLREPREIADREPVAADPGPNASMARG